jgi:hypothetical protein
LLVLSGGARRDLVEKFAGVAGISAAELRKGREEMVMSGHALRRHEAAHREGIDQCIIKRLCLRHVCSRHVAGLTHGLGLDAPMHPDFKDCLL